MSSPPRCAAACTRGQAAVELVALLPALALVGAVCWQLVLAGHAVWSVHAAARAAARAQAVGHDAGAAARASLPRSLLRGAVVRERGHDVAVSVRLPGVLLVDRLTTFTARAAFPPQS